MMLRWSWIFSSVAVFVMRLFCHIRLWSTRCWAVIWKCSNPHCASQQIQRERRLAEVSTMHPRQKKLVPRLAPTTTSTAEISTVRTDIPVQLIAVIPRQPRIHSIVKKAMVQPWASSSTRALEATTKGWLSRMMIMPNWSEWNRKVSGRESEIQTRK